MINKFITGIGLIYHPFDVGGHVSIAKVAKVPAPGGTKMNIVVDHAAKPALGNLGIPSQDKKVSSAPITVVPTPVPIPAPLPKPLSALGRVANPKPASNPVSFVPDIQPQVFSSDSSQAPFETIFNEFQLQAVPFYNFWTADETTNDTEDRGGRNLDDVPRFIKVSWVCPPVITGQSRLGQSDVNHRKIRPVRFGNSVESPVIVSIKGVDFFPDHLQPSNFSEVIGHVANGHISPGIISATAEMPLRNTLLDQSVSSGKDSPAHDIDEDMFLSHPDTLGVSIHELKANIHQTTSGFLGAVKVSESPVSRNGSRDRQGFFEGKFAVAKSVSNEKLSVQSVQGSTSPISLSSTSAVQKEGIRPDHVFDLAMKVSKSKKSANVDTAARVKVNFINPSIGGIVDQKKVNLMSEPHHAESMVAIAQMLPKLEVLAESGILEKARRQEMPSFPSPPGLFPLEYVGFVLEKYRQNDAGVFELVDIIKLPSNDYDSYVDCKVLYGVTYRYRIRSIIRWTRENDVETLRKRLLVQGTTLSTSALSRYESSYFAGEWSREWAYGSLLDIQPPDYPDELTVRAESARKRVAITCKLPNNPQRDIYAVRILKKHQDAEGRDVTDWTQIAEFGAQNVLFYDLDVDYFQNAGLRYVYTAQCLSRHHEESTLSDQLGVRLNSDFNVRGEFPVDFVSCGGVKASYFGSFSVYPHRTFRSELVSFPEGNSATFSIGVREAVGSRAMDDSTYVVRVESLDTGEKKDTKVTVSYDNQKPLFETITDGVYIPLAGPETDMNRGNGSFGQDLATGRPSDPGKASELIDKPIPRSAF